MKIIVVGCGKIGSSIIASLVSEGHEVVGIDVKPDASEKINNLYDAICIQGNGADTDVLIEAGVGSSELIVAVTGSDELNMLICFLAKNMGAKHTIARIRNPEYNGRGFDPLKKNLLLSGAINPEYLTAQEIYNILKCPNAVNVEYFSGRKLEMAEMILREDSPFIGCPLMELRSKFPAKFLICAVQRGDDVFIPGGSFVLSKGDKIGLSAPHDELRRLFKQTGLLGKKANSVMIVGASKTAYYLTKMLLSGGYSVTVIEKDRERCEEFERLLPGIIMINGDGAEQELLFEEGISTTDAFVTLTGLDEENILISCFARSQKVSKVVAKINRSELCGMAEKLGLECVVSPKNIISDLITSYARALENSIGSKVETLYKLMDGTIEALEFAVNSDFPYLDTPIKKMNIKKDILIAGIVRGRESIIPAGDDVIRPGDSVVVLSAGTHLQDLSEIIDENR